MSNCSPSSNSKSQTNKQKQTLLGIKLIKTIGIILIFDFLNPFNFNQATCILFFHKYLMLPYYHQTKLTNNIPVDEVDYPTLVKQSLFLS